MRYLDLCILCCHLLTRSLEIWAEKSAKKPDALPISRYQTLPDIGIVFNGHAPARSWLGVAGPSTNRYEISISKYIYILHTCILTLHICIHES